MRNVFDLKKGWIRVVVRRVPEWNEYQVHYYEDNVKQPDRTYYTDDKQDAIDTARCMIGEVKPRIIRSIT